MSDLVERLRKWYEPESTTDLCNEAADEIERQKAEIEWLRKALTEIADLEDYEVDVAPNKALRALRSEQGEP